MENSENQSDHVQFHPNSSFDSENVADGPAGRGHSPLSIQRTVKPRVYLRAQWNPSRHNTILTR